MSFEGFSFNQATRPADKDPVRSAFPLQEELVRAFGLENEAYRIAEALPYDPQLIELVDVLNFMARLGYEGAPLDCAKADLDARLLPCVFVDRGGRISVVTEPTKSRDRGTAYFFTRIEETDARDEQESISASGKGWLFSVVQRFRFLFVKVAALSLMINAVGIGLPLFLMVIFNRASDITTDTTIFVLGGGAALAIWIEHNLRNLRAKRLAWFAARIDHMASNRVLSRLLQLPAQAVENAPVNSQVARLRTFEAIREFFNGPLFLTLLELPFTVIGFVALLLLGGPLCLIPLVILGLYALTTVFYVPRLKVSMFEMAKARSKVQSHHLELFEKLEAVRLNGMTEIWHDQYRDVSAQSSLTLFRGQFESQVVETIVYTLTIVGGTALIYFGVMQVWHGHLSGGGLFASIMLFWRFISPWQSLVSSLPRLEQLRQSMGQVDRLMAIQTERETAPSLSKTPALAGGLAVSRVGLRYTKDTDPVFVGLNFSLLPGQLLAVSGVNGSGKSTVLKLLLGLYRPQAGAVYLDGADIRQLDPVDLRHSLAYIPQIPELFIGTIAENLRLSRPYASDEQLWEALAMADAKSAVEALPVKLDTDATTLPSALSYQINLARAYLKDAPIMLIDELPYALINSPAGQAFIDRIKAWKGHKTIVMVTHRDDFIRMADKALGLLGSDRFLFGDPDQVVSMMRDESYSQQARRAQ